MKIIIYCFIFQEEEEEDCEDDDDAEPSKDEATKSLKANPSHNSGWHKTSKIRLRLLLLKLDKQIGGTIYWPILAVNKA